LGVYCLDHTASTPYSFIADAILSNESCSRHANSHTPTHPTRCKSKSISSWPIQTGSQPSSAYSRVAPPSTKLCFVCDGNREAFLPTSETLFTCMCLIFHGIIP
jgi:hypothetical protein